MTNTPSISVIVPVYNVERYIKSCVDSILAQTFQDFEIILVDDASPDKSVELCQKLYGGNDKIRLVRHEKNLGLGPARNTGMKLARGKYIYFVDSDDFILPDALEKLFNTAERTNAQIVRTAGWYELNKDEAEPVRAEDLKLTWTRYNQEGFIKNDIFFRFEELWKKIALNPSAWCGFYRRDFLEENQIQFISIICEDVPFHLVVLGLAERFYLLHDAMYVYRIRENSIMTAKDVGKLSRAIHAMVVGSIYTKNFLKRLPDTEETKIWRDGLLMAFFDSFFIRQITLPFYENLKLTPEMNETVNKALLQFFGDGAPFARYFFNGYHIFRRQVELLAQQIQQLNDNILSLINRADLSPRKIVFVNFIGRGYGCNPKYIAEEILRRNLPYDLVWLVRDINEPMPAKIRKVVYGSLDSIYELATAKVIVSNTKHLLPFPRKKDGQFFIMTWHGGPGFKKVEKETEETLSPRYLAESKANSAITDLILVNSREQFDVVRRSFWYTGEILNVGLPRNDIFFRRNDELIARVRKTLNVPPENKIAMYAPTFRDDRNATDVYKFDAAKFLDALHQKFGGDWTLLVRFHPNVANMDFAKQTFADKRIVNATAYPDMQELIVVSDVLVSDYSSVIYEFMILRKPVFVFAKDFDTYPKERGFKQLYFELPYKVCRTETELFDCVATFDGTAIEPAIKEFLDNVKPTDSGHASEVVVDRIKAVVENNKTSYPPPLHGNSSITMPPPREITGAFDNWKTFAYVSERYGDFLAKLPVYESSGDTPKIFWWCWLQGEDNAPPLCKVCLKSLRRSYSDYKINVVTQENLSNYVSFPEHIVQKFNAGQISRTHFSDLLRLELLINYGGTWIDSTVFCTGREQNFLHEPLFIFQGTWRNEPAHLGSSWFIVACKGNPILQTTRDLLYEYWREHETLGKGGFYFLFHCMFKLAAQKYLDAWAKVPVFSNVPPHILQFEFFKPFNPDRFEQIKHMSNFHKLTWKYSAAQLSPEKTAGTNYEYLMKFFS